MNVIAYLRVSGRSQIDGDGPERQRASIQAFCTAHNLNLDREFFEAGVSGTVDGLDRPKFAEMVQVVLDQRQNGNSIDGIVVERMDRIARDLMVSEVLLAECRKRKIQVFSVDQGMLIDMASDGVDPTRVLIRQIMGALAQWEKTTLVNKLRAARIRTGRHGGLKKQPLSDKEKQIFHFLQEARIMGRYVTPEPPTLETLAGMLNEAGWKTGGGKDWNRKSVHAFIGRAEKTKA